MAYLIFILFLIWCTYVLIADYHYAMIRYRIFRNNTNIIRDTFIITILKIRRWFYKIILRITRGRAEGNE